jgi:hypothetical protein
MLVKMCDTEGCGSIENVTTIAGGDFCEACLEGQRFTNDVALAYREADEGQVWAEVLDDRYQSWVNEY